MLILSNYISRGSIASILYGNRCKRLLHLVPSYANATFYNVVSSTNMFDYIVSYVMCDGYLRIKTVLDNFAI